MPVRLADSVRGEALEGTARSFREPQGTGYDLLFSSFRGCGSQPVWPIALKVGPMTNTAYFYPSWVQSQLAWGIVVKTGSAEVRSPFAREFGGDAASWFKEAW